MSIAEIAHSQSCSLAHTIRKLDSGALAIIKRPIVDRCAPHLTGSGLQAATGWEIGEAGLHSRASLATPAVRSCMAKQTYMLVERLKDAAAVYTRFWERGRLAPKGLKFVSAWVDEHVERGYRLVQSDGRQPIDDWIANWSDLIDFEVHMVTTPEVAGEKVAARLRRPAARATSRAT